MNKTIENNAALRIVVMLGAYCPRVKLSDDEALKRIVMREKRRTRPMIGRGDYGKSLRAHFDKRRFEVRHAVNVPQTKLAA